MTLGANCPRWRGRAGRRRRPARRGGQRFQNTHSPLAGVERWPVPDRHSQPDADFSRRPRHPQRSGASNPRHAGRHPPADGLSRPQRQQRPARAQGVDAADCWWPGHRTPPICVFSVTRRATSARWPPACSSSRSGPTAGRCMSCGEALASIPPPTCWLVAMVKLTGWRRPRAASAPSATRRASSSRLWS